MAKQETLDEMLDRFASFGELSSVYSDPRIDKAVENKLTADVPFEEASKGPGSKIKVRPFLAIYMNEFQKNLAACTLENRAADKTKVYHNDPYQTNILISYYRRKVSYARVNDLVDLGDPYGHWTGLAFDMGTSPHPGEKFEPRPSYPQVWKAARDAGLANPFLGPPGTKTMAINQAKKDELDHLVLTDEKAFELGSRPYEYMHFSPFERKFDPSGLPHRELMAPESLIKTFYREDIDRQEKEERRKSRESESDAGIEPIAPTAGFEPRLGWWDQLKLWLEHPELLKRYKLPPKGVNSKAGGENNTSARAFDSYVATAASNDKGFTRVQPAASLGFLSGGSSAAAPAARSVVAGAARAALARAAKDRNYRQYIDTVNVDTRGSFDAQKLLAALEAYGRSEVANVG